MADRRESMPFGENGEHVTIRLIDFDDLEQNQYVVTQQYTFRAGKAEKRADLVLLVNGMPLVLIEAKTPVRRAELARRGTQVHDDYERNVPELFVRTSSRSPPRARSSVRRGPDARRALGPVAARGRLARQGVEAEGGHRCSAA